MNNEMILGSLRTLAAASALVAVGCGSEVAGSPDGEEAVMSTSAGIGEAACADAPGGLQFDGGANVFVYPYSDASCYKAMRVTIVDYSSEYLGPGDVPGGTDVSWADAHRQGGPALPTTQAACEKLWVRADLYRLSGAGWLTVASKSSRGVWSGGCQAPTVSFTEKVSSTEGELYAGTTYRIAGTARMDRTSGAQIAGITFVSHPPDP
jgi:hypothetical protein